MKPLRFSLLLVLIVVAACSADGSTQAGGTSGQGGSGEAGAGGSGGLRSGAPRILSFGAEPLGLAPGGGELVLQWEVEGADELRIDQGVGEVSGSSARVAVAETTTFKLTASNGEGDASEQTLVVVSSGEAFPYDRTATTSVDLIETALADGDIDDVDALRYKVFALFMDSRLPPELASSGRVHGTPIMKELASRFDSLPTSVQQELRPFMLAPTEPASWYQSLRNKSRALKGASGTSFNTADIDGARVWWDAALAEPIQEYNRNIVTQAVKNALDKLPDLMGRDPIPHGTYPGVDPDTYHVFVVASDTSSDLGWCSYENFDSARGGFPSHVTINLRGIASQASSAPQSSEELLLATVGHELMHAIQTAFDSVDNNTQPLEWLAESTATWSEQFLYPAFNTEQLYAEDYLNVPALALDDVTGVHEYGGYVFHLYLDEQLGEDTIAQIYQNTESARVFEAIDQAMGGALDELWGEFTAFNWNEDPVNRYFEWDTLSDQVFDSSKIESVSVTAQQQVYEMQLVHSSSVGPALGVDYLSAQYFHYDLTDPSAHTILFANGFNYDLEDGFPDTNPPLPDFDTTYFANELSDDEKKGRHVYALVKKGGAWLEDPYDLTEVAFVPFCQDYQEERIEELVVIVSNSRFAEGERQALTSKGLDPLLFVSNAACGDWVGWATATTRINDETTMETTDVAFNDIAFMRDRIPVEQLLEGAGQFSLFGPILPADANNITLFGARYRLDTISVEWSTNRVTGLGSSNVCVANGSGMFGINDAFLEQFDYSSTLTAPTGEDGSRYRSYFIQLGFLSSNAPVTVNCDMQAPFNDAFGAALAGGLRNTEFGLFELSPDGLFMERTWSVDSGDTTFELGLVGISD